MSSRTDALCTAALAHRGVMRLKYASLLLALLLRTDAAVVAAAAIAAAAAAAGSA
jgi:hypothetical protein